MALDEERAISPRDHCHRWHRLPSTTGASSSEARCQQATTCRRRGVAYLRRAPAPCATERPPRWALLAGCPACVTEYRIDAGLRQQNLVQMYAVVSSCTRLYRYTAVRRPQNCRRVDHFRRQMDHVIKTADESITSPKFT